MSRSVTLIAVLTIPLVLAVGCGDDSSTTDTSASAETTAGTGDGLALETCGDVEFGGTGTPEGLIVSDLPMRGDSAERSNQQVEAIRLMLEQNDWSAGDTPVAFQACDDSSAKTGLWDEKICEDNATAYAADERVLGVVGTYNSGCAAIEIPILNEADVAMISPGNTAVCLTERSSLCEDGQPESLYPSGTRNYARVIPNDAFQGAALAKFVADLGASRPFVLYAADDPTSTGQAQNFRGAAAELGLDLAGYESWDPDAKDYSKLFDGVTKSAAGAVVLAGLTEQNGATLIDDKVEIVGSNANFPLVAFDGFAQQSTIDDAGKDSLGMFASIPGSAPENLSAEGVTFADDLSAALDGAPVEQFAPYAAEAAAVLLGAIDTAGTDRAAITEAVLTTEGGGGILNPYDIGPNGDPTVGPVTILEAGETFEVDTEVTPDEVLVKAARG
jgi:branched-chain amino acid transport system substrate-binding protein